LIVRAALFKRLYATLALGLGVLAMPVLAADKADEALANANAANWLLHLDAGDYEGSWRAASSFWQHDHSLEKTEKVLRELRGPLGALRERNARSFEFLPSPDGEVAYITFSSKFEDGKDAIETVELLRESSGEWKVSSWAFRDAKRK